jgi:dienelactone hydrolase
MAVPFTISAGGVPLQADFDGPPTPTGLVIFAHGSGSGRFSPRNRAVAGTLRRGGLATLLADLLTADEEALDAQTGHLRFNIPLLAERLIGLADWAARSSETTALPIGYFGASTGGGAALVAAAERPRAIRAVVSRGGRPDLAGEALHRVEAPTLLIVGGNDPQVVELNERAYGELAGEKSLEIIPGATHLFEEPGALEEVARLALCWFQKYLR